MKKTLCIFLSALVLLLAGCGGTDAPALAAVGGDAEPDIAAEPADALPETSVGSGEAVAETLRRTVKQNKILRAGRQRIYRRQDDYGRRDLLRVDLKYSGV